MGYCHRHKLPVGTIKFMQFFVIGKFFILPLNVVCYVHARDVIAIACILIKPFQKGVSNTISCVWDCLMGVFS